MPDANLEVYLARIQTDPNASDTPTATAFFGTTATVNGITFEAPLAPISWPLQSPKTVTLSDGTVLTYSQVSEGVVTIAYTEKAMQDAAAAAAAEAAANPLAEEPQAEEPAPTE